MDRSYYRYHVDFCRWIGVTTDIMLIFADGSKLLQISCWFLQRDYIYKPIKHAFIVLVLL